MKSRASGFLKRAEAEARRYGSDPWVLFRELGQNSRDAGAGQIEVLVEEQGDRFRLTFADDGRGMTFDHARRYFVRLYSSSKDDDQQAAGRYGVGFWSVLLFRPERIEVYSRSNQESWGVVMSGDLEQIENAGCARRSRGTTIVLERRIEPGQRDELLRGLKSGLQRYLAFLRTAERKARPLPVTLNGRSLSRPFRLKGAGSLSFQDGPVEGVVGFGDRPRYDLYARGLPVLKGHYLEELEGSASAKASADRRRQSRDRGGQRGVSPVYLLNGNQLDVVLSRQTVMKNRSLEKLIETARRRFDQLVSETVGRTVKRGLLLRLWDQMEGFLVRAGQVPAWARWSLFLLGLFTLGGILGILAIHLDGGGGGGERVRIVSDGNRPGSLSAAGSQPESTGVHVPAFKPDEIDQDFESTVDQPGPEPEWSLAYQPPVPLWFRLVPMERFDPRKGWQPGADGGGWSRPAGGGQGEAVRVEMGIGRESGRMLLPVPSGHVPVRNSGKLGDKPLRLETNRAGQVRVTLPDGAGRRLSYRVAPDGGGKAPDWFAAGRAVLPDHVERELGRIRLLDPSMRIRRTVELVQKLLVYDRSLDTARRFEQNSQAQWVARVIATGAGDCDLINGVLAVLLNQVDVPARLAVGIVGREGRALPGTHAWVEAWEDGMLVADATLLRQGYGGPALLRQGSGGQARQSQTTVEPAPVVGKNRVLPLVMLFASLALLAGLVVLFVRKMARPGDLTLDQDDRKRRALLAGMALEAIRRPSAWVEIPGLWHRPFLPCLGRDKVLSLSRLLNLAGRDRLFIGRRNNPLCKAAQKSGVRVLDRDDPEFASLFESLGNLRDLDELMDFRPVEMSSGKEAELLAAVNKRLDKWGAGIRLHATAVRDQRVFVDIDLSPIRSGPRGFPRRFVAVNPDDAWLGEMAGLFSETPELAICRVVDRLGRDSVLIRPLAAKLRRQAARSLIAAALLRQGYGGQG